MRKRTFQTGATRDVEDGKLDLESYDSPLVDELFGEYMLAHNSRRTIHGTADNWQKGIPFEQYLKSLMRHLLDVRKLHDGFTATDRRTGKPITLEDACCAVRFNINGMIYELARKRQPRRKDR